MNSIRWRINFIVFMTFALTFTLAWKANKYSRSFSDAQARSVESLGYRAILLSLRDEALNQDTANRLHSFRKGFATQEARASAWGELIVAYTLKDRKQLDAKIRSVNKIETDILAESNVLAAEYSRKAERFATLAILAPLLGLLWVANTTRKRVFKPVGRLSNRMKDFLVDRYSFQFSQPDATELGDLQRNFNSLAQRVINTMDELKSLDQAKSEFLNIASHELRTPLTSIKGSLSLLASGVIGPMDLNTSRLLKIAEVETDRLIRLINDLLDLAKIEAGKLPLVCTWMSWDEMVSKTTEGLMGLAHKANVKINYDPAPGLEVYMDRDRIQQVLTNLISNAVKFSPADGVVRITFGRTRTGELLVNVIDQGPGISKEDQELIFQKFRQGTTEKNPLVKGTGLGLAIAKALVEEHGGSIGVESHLTNGSAFWFTLPKWRDDESTSEDPSHEGRAA